MKTIRTAIWRSAVHNNTEEYNKADGLSATRVRRVQGRPRHTVRQCSTCVISLVNCESVITFRSSSREVRSSYVYDHIYNTSHWKSPSMTFATQFIHIDSN